MVISYSDLSLIPRPPYILYALIFPPALIPWKGVKGRGFCSGPHPRCDSYESWDREKSLVLTGSLLSDQSETIYE